MFVSYKWDSAGEKNGMAKLSEKQVSEIRALHSQGVEQKTLAERYGVSRRTISRIVTKSGWTQFEYLKKS